MINRYQTLFVLLLCMSSTWAAFSFGEDIVKDHSIANAVDNADFLAAIDQIDQKQSHEEKRVPLTAIEYEKNDEEDVDSRGKLPVNNASVVYTLSVEKAGVISKELHKVIWKTTRFVWNLHTSRRVFFQVFRI